MSISTNQLQQLPSVQLTDSILLDSPAAGTARITMAQAAAFLGAELAKEGNPIGTALSNKAALSVQETLELTAVKGRHVDLAASELQAYIDALPRMLTEHLTLDVTGELNTVLELKNFYGPGRLAIYGGRGFTMGNALRVSNCPLFIYLTTVDFREREGMSGSLLYLETNSYVYAYRCGFTGLGAKSDTTAAFVTEGSKLTLGEVRISDCAVALTTARGSVTSFNASLEDAPSEFSGNAQGAAAWNGGIILLGHGIPDTLGAAANRKYGGLRMRTLAPSAKMAPYLLFAPNPVKPQFTIPAKEEFITESEGLPIASCSQNSVL